LSSLIHSEFVFDPRLVFRKISTEQQRQFEIVDHKANPSEHFYWPVSLTYETYF